MSENLYTFTRWRLAALLAGVAAFFVFAFFTPALRANPEWGARPAFAAGGAALMAIWWLTEALPIYVTACVPLVLFPLTQVFGAGLGVNVKGVLGAYLDPYIFLFAGGMAIAAAMQQWNLHRRIALNIMQAIGTDPRHLLAGTLVATAAVSLWISNTATATMMMPIGMALIAQLEAQGEGKRLRSYGMAIMLAIAYGSNVGGIGTKIGTAPNAQFAGFLERHGGSVSFLQFLLVGLPFVVLFLPIVWLMLWRLGREDAFQVTGGNDIVRRELDHLGLTRTEEKITFGVFATAAVLWILGKTLTDFLRPQVTAFALTSAHVEATIAIAAALALLLWRRQGHAVLAPRSLLRVPWETLLLLGGGFAMAAAIQQSGLAAWMTQELAGLRSLPPFTQVLLASAAAVAISAVASNTSTIAVLLVVLHQAVSPGVTTTALFAATIGASCDFALPAGTPPNAIVFGSGYVSIPRMARLGVVLDLAAILLVALWCWLIVPLVMG